MTDIKGRSPRDPNPWYRGSKRYGDIGRHAPPGDELENTRDHERIWQELGTIKGGVTSVEGAPYHIKVFSDQSEVVVGKEFVWAVPGELGGTSIVSVECYVTTPSTSGKPTVQVRNRRTGLNVLSVPAEIEVGEEDSSEAATRSQIDPANAGVQMNDKLVIDPLIAGTGAKGLGVMVMFDADPGSDGGVGSPGPPGGTGPPGPPGPAGGAGYTHTQGAVSAAWVIAHGLGRYPSVTVVDTGGSTILPDIHFDNANQITLVFGAPTSGTAYLN